MNEKQLHALAAEFAKHLKTPEDLNQFSRMLKKITVEAALNAELTDHLGYEKHQPRKGKNARNGYRTLQNYLLNERDPSAEVLIKISSVLNVDLNWLMRGEGEVFRSSTNKNELSEKEKQLISHYRKMSSDMQVAFDISFRFLSEKQI